jgi:hypothetical protein
MKTEIYKYRVVALVLGTIGLQTPSDSATLIEALPKDILPDMRVSLRTLLSVESLLALL